MKDLRDEYVSESMRRCGGVVVPVYSNEALYLDLSSTCPAALRVGAGMVDAVTGREFSLDGDWS